MGLLRDIQKANRTERPKDAGSLASKDLSELQDYANEVNTTSARIPTSPRIKMSTTEGQLYLIAVDTLDRLDIQFVPLKLDLTRRPSIANIQVIGRNTPIYHYLSGETLLDLELDFHAMEENRKDVINKVRWLEHLTYNDGHKKLPQKVILVFGDLYNNDRWIVKSVKSTISQFNKQKGFLPQQATVKIQLGLDPEFNLGWEDVRSDGGKTHLGPTNGRT